MSEFRKPERVVVLDGGFRTCSAHGRSGIEKRFCLFGVGAYRFWSFRIFLSSHNLVGEFDELRQVEGAIEFPNWRRRHHVETESQRARAVVRGVEQILDLRRLDIA